MAAEKKQAVKISIVSSMLQDILPRQWLKFILSIILPTLLAIAISIASIYIVIIPSFEESFMESKRDMIRELTHVAWGIMAYYERLEQDGTMARTEAQQRAINEIEHLRYGDQSRDYFWITDMKPHLIMHPYSKELIGKDLSQFEDSEGKRVFMEIKKAAASGSGFLDYTWNKKYTILKDAPKLSFVKYFEPWAWVVGTGVFLDDVLVKTEKITRRLTRMIYGSIILFVLLLLFVVFRSLSIERKRIIAEKHLDHSRKKYKAMVETAVDPIMMIHNGTCIYTNKSMQNLLGYSGDELESLSLTELFIEDKTEKDTGRKGFRNALSGSTVLGEQEARLVRKDGQEVIVLMALNPKNLGSQKVMVMTAKDVSGVKRFEEQLEENRERYLLLASRLHFGVFRTTPESKLRFIEANSVTRELLDIAEGAQLSGLSLLDFLEIDHTEPPLFDMLRSEGYVKEKAFRLKQKNNAAKIFSISMVLAKNSTGQQIHCDAIIEDISEQHKSAEERENLIVELQTSLMFLNQPIKNSLTDFVTCDGNVEVGRAAQIMTDAGKSSILVCRESEVPQGIITDALLRERVLVGNIPAETPVCEVMSSPLIYIEDTALIFEAVLMLHERGIKHLVVRDSSGNIVSVISNEELLDVHRYSATFMIEQVRNSTTAQEIEQSLKRLPRIVKALTDSGAHARNITRIITTISDTVLGKLIDFAIEEIGEPPARFAFISLGSEGREEQTLVTDQDNALIFEDVTPDRSAAVHAYFQSLSTTVCTWLDQVGYDFCKGKVMAMNPDWCQPITTWQNYFSQWIADSRPEDLMEVSIFFDFRCLYGDRRLPDQLRGHIRNKAENQKAFFYQMAQNTLLFKVPIDFFGNIAVESGGEHPNTFNIKHAMAQIVGFARIYAIYYSLESTNTLQRLDKLQEKNILKDEIHEEIVEAYNYLMQLRFRHQVSRIDGGAEPDNHVTINELTHMEKDMLEKIFSQINQLRKRLSLVGHNEIYF